MEELNQLLLDVPDSYFDFVIGMMAYARNNSDRLDEIVEYLKSHKDVTTSDFLEWIETDIEGLDPDNLPNIVVDDDEAEEDE